MKILVLENSDSRLDFFLDRFGHNDLFLSESVENSIEYLKNIVFDYIFLNDDGLELVRFLVLNPDNENNKAVLVVHSWNVNTATNIRKIFNHVIYIPFDTSIFSTFRI